MTSIIQNSFMDLKILYALPVHSQPPQSLTIPDLHTVSLVSPSPECLIVGIIKYAAFSGRRLLLSNMRLRFFCVFHGLVAFQ